MSKYHKRKAYEVEYQRLRKANNQPPCLKSVLNNMTDYLLLYNMNRILANLNCETFDSNELKMVLH